jgi:hypothetical protein
MRLTAVFRIAPKFRDRFLDARLGQVHGFNTGFIIERVRQIQSNQPQEGCCE